MIIFFVFIQGSNFMDIDSVYHSSSKSKKRKLLSKTGNVNKKLKLTTSQNTLQPSTSNYFFSILQKYVYCFIFLCCHISQISAL